MSAQLNPLTLYSFRIPYTWGLEHITNKYNHLIIKGHMPEPGTPTQEVAAGYMANAWIQIKHPDYDELRGILNEIGETLKVIVH